MDSLDQDQTAHKMQSDPESALSSEMYLLEKTVHVFTTGWKSFKNSLLNDTILEWTKLKAFAGI